MSYPYCIAILLMTGKLVFVPSLWSNFSDKKFMDKIEEFGKRCEFVIDPAMDRVIPEKYPAAVEVHLKGGKKLSSSLELPRGFYPENPVGDKDLFDKFKDLASMVISPKSADSLMDMTMNLEKVEDVSQLTNILREK